MLDLLCHFLFQYACIEGQLCWPVVYPQKHASQVWFTGDTLDWHEVIPWFLLDYYHSLFFPRVISIGLWFYMGPILFSHSTVGFLGGISLPLPGLCWKSPQYCCFVVHLRVYSWRRNLGVWNIWLDVWITSLLFPLNVMSVTFYCHLSYLYGFPTLLCI